MSDKSDQDGESTGKVMSPCQPDDPINIAWEAWKKTHDFANSRRWASRDEHLDGSLWNAFNNGYRAGERKKDLELPEASSESALAYEN